MSTPTMPYTLNDKIHFKRMAVKTPPVWFQTMTTYKYAGQALTVWASHLVRNCK